MDKSAMLSLRQQGKTYTQIAAICRCSKWKVMYHLNPRRQVSIFQSGARYRKQNPLITKMTAFFRGNHRLQTKPKITKFSLKQLKKKIGPYPHCYLTGTTIDLLEPSTYSLDHIIPVTKGGESTLDNCALTCTEANMAKQNLSHADFVKLCQRVTEFHEEKPSITNR